MGLFMFIATIVAGAIGGYMIRGKVNKKEKSDPFKPQNEED